MRLDLFFSFHLSGQFITTSAEVTPNGGLVRESPQNGLKLGLGFIINCPDLYIATFQEVSVNDGAELLFNMFCSGCYLKYTELTYPHL